MVLPTTIAKLDELLQGGLKSNSSTLIIANPGINSSQFMNQIVYSMLSQGGEVNYLVNNKKPSYVRSLFKGADWNVARYEKNKHLTIIDAYTKIIKKTDFNEIDDFVNDTIEKTHQNTILVIDSLSSFLDSYGSDKTFLKHYKRWMNSASHLTLLVLFTQWPYKSSIISDIKSLFSCVVELKSIEKDIILRNYFTVSKARWIKKLRMQEVLFDIVPFAGVKEYIPKILVTGPYHAGKSTFTHAISTKSTSVDRLGTTVALDYGHVTHKGYTADVFGTPGQTRFDPLLEMLGHRALGLFLVLDSTKPESFARAEEMIVRCKASRLPYVVIANKQDLASALPINQIRKRLSLPKSVAIVPCVAVRKKGIKKALDILFDEVGG